MLSNITVPAFHPTFDGTIPPEDTLIWRISLSPATALRLLYDLGTSYVPNDHPRVSGMLEADGQVTLYLWSRQKSDSALLLLLYDYGRAHVADLSRLHGECWIAGELLPRTLAALVAKRYHEESAS